MVSDPVPTSQELDRSPVPAPANSIAVRPLVSREHDEIFIHLDLWRSLFLHRTLAGAIVAAGLIAAILNVVRTGFVYTAQSQLYVQPAPPRLMQTGGGNNWPYDATTYESYIQQQIQNMTRADVLAGAVKKLRSSQWMQPGETDRQAAERLEHSVAVARLGSSYQVSVTAHAGTAEQAADLSNALAGSFVEIARNELRAGDPARIELLREERDRIQKALAADRAEQEELNKRLGMATISAALPDPYDDQIRAIRAELVKAHTASDEAAARLTTVKGEDASSSAALDAEADQLIASDPGLVSMKTSLNQRRAVLVTQMANLTPNHPQYKQDAAELANINASLGSMMEDLRAKVRRNLQQRLKNDLERTSMVEAGLNAQLAQLTEAAGGAVPRLQRSTELATDIQRLQNRFTAVDEQFRNLTMEDKAPGAAYISSAAVPPLHPAIVPVLRNAGILVLGSLLVAMMAVIAAHNLDPRVYIAKDIERVLGLSPMAQLPDFRQVSKGTSEEYLLRLAGAIEHAFQQRGLKSCIFTGAAAGAGVTTLATRVTSMLEGMGRSTVLVNASGTPPAPAQGEPAIPDSSDDDATHLMKVEAETDPRSLLQQMGEEIDADTIVLTDTAPLLTSGETEYLARFVDSAIVVIQSGLTTREQLREVAHTLQRLEVTAVGFVLNRVSIEKANPSFRQSVRAVEQRLAIQNRVRERHTTRTRPSAHRSPEAAEASPVVNDPEPVHPPEPSGAPDARSAPAGRSSGAADEGSSQAKWTSSWAAWSSGASAGRPDPKGSPPGSSDPAGRPAPERPSGDSSATASGTEPGGPEPAPSRRVTRGRGEPQRATPGPAQAACPTPPKPNLPPAGAERVAPARPVPAAPRRTVTPPPMSEVPRPAAGVPRLSDPPANLPAERWMTPSPLVSEEPIPDDLVSERQDGGYAAASRLGGLRNLLVSLGRRSLNSEEEIAPASRPDIEPRFERATVRPAYPDTPETGPEAPDGGVPARLNAEPEFLPPKPVMELEKEKEKESMRTAPTPQRRDNAESDEIQTLPSWRGQYRKKRYPPL